MLLCVLLYGGHGNTKISRQKQQKEFGGVRQTSRTLVNDPALLLRGVSAPGGCQDDPVDNARLGSTKSETSSCR